MMHKLPLRSLLAAMLVTAAITPALVAQDETAAPSNQSKPADASSNSQQPTESGSAEDVMNNLINQMKRNPLIEPTTPASTPGQEPGQMPAGNDPAAATGHQPIRVGVDPNVIGVAPGARPGKLRREGEFVIGRKGRLVRSSDGLHTLFVFDADDSKSPESPMAMVPCQMLQSMEDLLGQRGEDIKFVLSGQILVYRGVNYILPTMMTLAEDRGNLQ